MSASMKVKQPIINAIINLCKQSYSIRKAMHRGGFALMPPWRWRAIGATSAVTPKQLTDYRRGLVMGFMAKFRARIH
ncbi:hypothetical protein MITS9509_01925 [Synechococcus sp. MIT S9509]|nr:hypothetical protein MITS9504_01724 [Synechococcus sp. MIT S9504]KZR92004.1 hypothetical protein MITS9509_01925 [Synechococcus sp. MIT S9509]